VSDGESEDRTVRVEFIPVTHSVPAPWPRLRPRVPVTSNLDLTRSTDDVPTSLACGPRRRGRRVVVGRLTKRRGSVHGAERSVGGALRRSSRATGTSHGVAWFSRAHPRVQQISTSPRQQHRKIVLTGRSMEATATGAQAQPLCTSTPRPDQSEHRSLAPAGLRDCNRQPGRAAPACRSCREATRVLEGRCRRHRHTEFASDPGNEWTVGRVTTTAPRPARVIHSVTSRSTPRWPSLARANCVRSTQLLRPRTSFGHGEYRPMVPPRRVGPLHGAQSKHVLICKTATRSRSTRPASDAPARFRRGPLHRTAGGRSDDDRSKSAGCSPSSGSCKISAGVDKDHSKIIQPVRLTARGWLR